MGFLSLLKPLHFGFLGPEAGMSVHPSSVNRVIDVGKKCRVEWANHVILQLTASLCQEVKKDPLPTVPCQCKRPLFVDNTCQEDD